MIKKIILLGFMGLLFFACDKKIAEKVTDDDIWNKNGNDTDLYDEDGKVDSEEEADEKTDDSTPDKDNEEGCFKSSDCIEGYFCKKPDNGCTSEGICTKKPEGCDYEEDEPFCGCDMQNHRNRCFANSYGINIKSKGFCPDLERCTKDEDCPENTFCDHFYETCEGEGICKEKPLECYEFEYVLCGCDEKTHKNLCYAQMAGTGIMHPGGCGSMEECTKNSDCLDTEYCSKKEGVCEESAKGKCDLKRDEMECMMYSAIMYVCGCDGVTYQHPCFASNAGTTIDHEGECE